MTSNRGFTLIELLVVIAIVAVLAGILLPVLSIMKTKGKITTARREMQALAAAIKEYQSAYNRYPAAPLRKKSAAAMISRSGPPASLCPRAEAT